ncbi:major facilitator superfamily domain-containing protein [Mucidula mucida]|nr:major facilitator superfamily domain-containing protein [Mucidula mucida]
MDPSTQSSEHLPPFNDMEKSAEKQDTSVIVDPLEVPNGGTVAWMTLVGAFLAVFCSSGYVNVYGIYEDFFVREYLSESSSFQISWIGSVQVLFLGCSGIPGGYAMDHGYFRWVMLSGSLLLMFYLVMTLFCREQQFWQMFLANCLGLGIAVGMLYVPAIGVLLHHFKKRRSLIMGLAQAGSSVGGLVHPIMLNNLFHGRLGFAWGVRVSALFNLVLLIIANLLMTTRLPARPKDTTFNKQIMYWKSFFTDKVYVLATLSIFILYCGVYFPTFFSNSTQWRMIRAILTNGI